jgi:predicted RNA binding protein YcfA (HicA-like mRNA interferase family)
MSKGSHKLRIPNDHGSDISAPLIREILRQAHIDPKEWDAV